MASGEKKRRGRATRISAETWIDTAVRTLVEEGIAGVKVDRLASRLGVTRGGFYHHFRDREELLQLIIKRWQTACHFLPDRMPGTMPEQAIGWLDELVDRLIEEDGYDPHLDMAVREWSRTDQKVAWAVERSDMMRVVVLARLFGAFGYDAVQSDARARAFYLHQIGYYATRVRETVAERRRSAAAILDIYCGEDRLRAARLAAGQR